LDHPVADCAFITMKFTLPDIPEAEQTPLIKGLLAVLEQLIENSQKQQEKIEVMKDEIRILKGEKKRPKFTPSKLDESNNNEMEGASESADKTEPSDKKDAKTKKARRSKKGLPVDREERIKPHNITQGSRYKGYRDLHVQELVLKSD
jgi:hypothetical protein